MCIIVSYSQAVSVFISAYTLIAISIDRYIAIIYPLRPRMTKLQAKLIIFCVWIVAILTPLPTAVLSRLMVPEGWIQDNITDKYICTEEWDDYDQRYYYSMALMILQYVFPLTVLIFTYAKIAWNVWGKTPPGEAEDSRDRRMAQSKRRVTWIQMFLFYLLFLYYYSCIFSFYLICITWKDSLVVMSSFSSTCHSFRVDCCISTSFLGSDTNFCSNLFSLSSFILILSILIFFRWWGSSSSLMWNIHMTSIFLSPDTLVFFPEKRVNSFLTFYFCCSDACLEGVTHGEHLQRNLWWIKRADGEMMRGKNFWKRQKGCLGISFSFLFTTKKDGSALLRLSAFVSRFTSHDL